MHSVIDCGKLCLHSAYLIPANFTVKATLIDSWFYKKLHTNEHILNGTVCSQKCSKKIIASFHKVYKLRTFLFFSLLS